MKRVLFVDDKIDALEQLRQSLQNLCKDWEIVHATDAEDALEELSSAHFDVIASDIDLPESDGAILLGQVKRRFPQVVRILFTGHSAEEAGLQATPVIHQFIDKKCNPVDMRETIERCSNLHSLLRDEKLKRAVGNMNSLPSLPSIYQELTTALSDTDVPMHDVTRIIEKDIAMCAKILQVINSAYFGFSKQVTSVQKAISYIGANMIKNLVLSVEIFRSFDVEDSLPGFSMDEQQRHALQVADSARKLFHPHPRAEDAFTAGMLHDVGKLILATQLPDAYKTILREHHETERAIHEIERDIIGVSHAEIGAYLLGLWGLPYSIVEAVAYHHNPSLANNCDMDVVAAVHIADALSYDVHEEECEISELPIHPFYHASGTIASRVSKWREMTYRLSA